MAPMEIPEEALDGALVLACGFVILSFELGVTDVRFAVFAPIFWGGFPVFGHCVDRGGWVERSDVW